MGSIQPHKVCLCGDVLRANADVAATLAREGLPNYVARPSVELRQQDRAAPKPLTGLVADASAMQSVLDTPMRFDNLEPRQNAPLLNSQYFQEAPKFQEALRLTSDIALLRETKERSFNTAHEAVAPATPECGGQISQKTSTPIVVNASDRPALEGIRNSVEQGISVPLSRQSGPQTISRDEGPPLQSAKPTVVAVLPSHEMPLPDKRTLASLGKPPVVANDSPHTQHLAPRAMQVKSESAGMRASLSPGEPKSSRPSWLAQSLRAIFPNKVPSELASHVLAAEHELVGPHNQQVKADILTSRPLPTLLEEEAPQESWLRQLARTLFPSKMDIKVRSEMSDEVENEDVEDDEGEGQQDSQNESNDNPDNTDEIQIDAPENREKRK